MSIYFADCEVRCLGQPWWYTSEGRDKLVTELTIYPSSTICCSLTPFYSDIELVRSNSILLPFLAVSGYMYLFEIYPLGHNVGGSNYSLAVDSLECTFLQYLIEGHI
jgi:hypothetical protein